jgi:hypothetical protein
MPNFKVGDTVWVTKLHFSDGKPIIDIVFPFKATILRLCYNSSHWDWVANEVGTTYIWFVSNYEIKPLHRQMKFAFAEEV